MANALGIDLAAVYQGVDAVKTARLRNQLAEQAMADQQELKTARGLAASGAAGGFEALAVIDPSEALQFRNYFDGLKEKEKAEKIKEAREGVEEMGKLAATVASSDDPESTFNAVRESLPPHMKEKLPQQYDPQAIDLMLARLMDTDQLLDMVENKKRSNAISSALGVGLVQSESGGNFAARNDVPGSGGVGHFGRGQFSQGRLAEAQSAGVMPAGQTPEGFLEDPETQAAVEEWHRNDVMNFAQQTGVTGMVGQSVAGIPVTEQGIFNVAHLGGKEGMRKFFETGGEYDPADANGTRLSDYLALGAREAGVSAEQSPQQAQGPDPRAVMASLLQAGVPESQTKMILDLLSPEPQSMMNVAPGSSVFDPNTGRPVFTAPRAQEQGWRAATPEELAQYGAAAGQVGPNGEFKPINPPRGLSISSDGQGGFTFSDGVVAPAAADNGARTPQQMANDVVLEDIGRAKELVTGAGLLNPAVGLGSSVMARVGGSNATNLSALTDTIRANIGFDRLQAMREASPTGGALGNVTERELGQLQAVLGSLEQSQSEAQFMENLSRLERLYTETVHGPEAAAALDGGASQTLGAAGVQTAPGESATLKAGRLRYNPETDTLEPVQ